jgi:cardiolipin synthase A/B
MIKRLGRQMQKRGIEIYPVLPVNLFRRQIARIDLRNHRKLVIIDGRIAYTGSQNIVDANYGHRNLVWHDMMVRLTGPVVLDLQRVFVEDWYLERREILDGLDIFPQTAMTGTTPVQTLPSGPSYPTENYQRMVVAALHDARQHVIITTPYFIPDEAFIQAIEVAVLSDVKVELIVPHRSNQILVDTASHAYYEGLLDIGVKIYLYNEGLLHAKTMSIDNSFAFIGSSNFDIRSFALNFEINLVFYGSEVSEKLRAAQNRYISNSVQLTREVWKQRPKIHKFLQNIAQLLSPLL